MVNLIPPHAKKGVVVEYWLRVLTVWSLIVTVAAALVAVSFLPVYVLVDAKIDVYEESAEAASQKIASFDAVSPELVRSSQQAQLLLGSIEDVSLSEVISRFSALATDGIELNSISVSRRGVEGTEPVVLLGVARDRIALSNFRDRLLAEESVATVDFPISSLVAGTDINFPMEITMHNQMTP